MGPYLDDDAMTRLWLTVDERFGFRPSKEFFWDVVTDAARRDSFHPVRDYLAALAWDGVPRIARWLMTYGEVEDTPYPPSPRRADRAPIARLSLNGRFSRHCLKAFGRSLTFRFQSRCRRRFMCPCRLPR